MRRWFWAGIVGVAGCLAVSAAEARVNIQVDLSTQTMTVDSAQGSFVWPISSARDGYRTPNGTYRVQRMEVMHRSRKYHNSPMPHSLFFSGGYAIHGSYEIAALGQPASHGCIRLAPENAAMLFRMVADEGARIRITGSPDAYRYVARHERGRGYRMQPDDDSMDSVYDGGAGVGAPVVDPWAAPWGSDQNDDDTD